MRRLAVAACAAGSLAAAGAAVADSIGTRAVKPVTATFSATTVLSSKTRSCATPAGQITASTLDLSGTATSAEAALNGPLRLRVAAVVDSAAKAGVVEGALRIDAPGERDTIARLDAVYRDGHVHGLLRGSAQRPLQRLVADVSADLALSPAPAVTNGKIGATDGGGGAVLVQPGRCPTASAEERVEATGQVTAVSSTSITVAGITCSVPAELAARVARLAVGDRARITCRRQGSELVLVKVDRKKR